MSRTGTSRSCGRSLLGVSQSTTDSRAPTITLFYWPRFVVVPGVTTDLTWFPARATAAGAMVKEPGSGRNAAAKSPAYRASALQPMPLFRCARAALLPMAGDCALPPGHIPAGGLIAAGLSPARHAYGRLSDAGPDTPRLSNGDVLCTHEHSSCDCQRGRVPPARSPRRLQRRV